MPAKPNKIFRTREVALAAHRMAMEGNDTLYEARVWKAFHEEFPDIAPGVIQSVLENNFDQLDRAPADKQLDLLVSLAGGSRPQPPARSSPEEWPKHRNPDEPLTTGDIVRQRAANRRQWGEASASKIAERRRAEAPLDAARKELARLKDGRAA